MGRRRVAIRAKPLDRGLIHFLTIVALPEGKLRGYDAPRGIFLPQVTDEKNICFASPGALLREQYVCGQKLFVLPRR